MSYCMGYWWNKGLNKEIQNNLKNRNYSFKEIEDLGHYILKLYYARWKVFKRLMILAVVSCSIALLCNLYYMPNQKFIAVVSVLIFAFITFLVMVYAYIVWVIKEKNQFIKCLRIGYPDLLE